MNKKSGVWNKIFGTILIVIGFVTLLIEYLVISGVKAIGLIIAGALGIEGAESIGVVLLCYVPVMGLILMLALVIVISFWTGHKLFKVGW